MSMSSETIEVGDVEDLANWIAYHLVQKYMDGADFPDKYAVDIINRILNDYNSHNYDDLVAYFADAVGWKNQTFKRRIWDALTVGENAELIHLIVRYIAKEGMEYYLDTLSRNAFELSPDEVGPTVRLIRNNYLDGSISFQNMIKEILGVIRPDIDNDYKLEWAQIGFELAKYLDEDTLKELVRAYLRSNSEKL